MKRYLAAALVLLSHPAIAASWYYCDSAKAYYPYVTSCPEQWREVPAQVQPAPQAQRPASTSIIPKPQPAQQTTSTPPIPKTPVQKPADEKAFQDGQADRQRLESWINSKAGDFRAGADYWVSHRSLPKPGSCNAAEHPEVNPDWVSGCIGAQQQLAAIDVRRRTEPDYRKGFNTAVPATTIPAATQTAPGQTAADTPNPEIKALLSKEDALNEKCRGGSGDDPNTQKACNERDKVFSELKSKGWCYGPDDKPMYQRSWMPCPSSVAPEDTKDALDKAQKQLSESLKDPQKVKLMECMGVKVYEDPQPAGHPPSSDECARVLAQAQQPPPAVRGGVGIQMNVSPDPGELNLVKKDPQYTDAVVKLIRARGFECPQLSNLYLSDEKNPYGVKLEVLCGSPTTDEVYPALHYTVFPQQLMVNVCKPAGFGLLGLSGCD